MSECPSRRYAGITIRPYNTTIKSQGIVKYAPLTIQIWLTFSIEVPITAPTHHTPKHMHENFDGVMTVPGQSLENIRTTKRNS